MGLSTKEMGLGSGLEERGNFTRRAGKHSAQLEAEMAALLFLIVSGQIYLLSGPPPTTYTFCFSL